MLAEPLGNDFAKGLMNLPELGLHDLVAPCIVRSGKPVDDSFDD